MNPAFGPVPEGASVHSPLKAAASIRQIDNRQASASILQIDNEGGESIVRRPRAYVKSTTRAIGIVFLFFSS